MQVLIADTVDRALINGLGFLEMNGDRRGSRNGPVIVAPYPVTTEFQQSRHRVSFWPERDANPFFHLYESLWMLGGMNDVASVAYYVKRMETFSDDGKVLHGAYGWRWRNHFGFDQLKKIIKRLRHDPDDRRCVLQMWDASEDLDVDSKDLPCNTQVYFTRNFSGALDMTVCCRSNDIIWGAYGANAVHFSMLQEYVATAVGCLVGTYWQVSNNYHAYVELYEKLLHDSRKTRTGRNLDPYRSSIRPFPLMSASVEDWENDLTNFLTETPGPFADDFFTHVAQPMHDAYRWHKDGDTRRAYGEIADRCKARDWQLAALGWLQRRFKES